MMLHRFRHAMGVPERARLSGTLEVDDMFVGGRNKPGMAGRSARPHKTPVLVMAERRARGIGRCRAVVLDRVDKASLRAALQDNIELGSTIRSDGLVVLHQWNGRLRSRPSLRTRLPRPAAPVVPSSLASPVADEALARRHPAGRGTPPSTYKTTCTSPSSASTDVERPSPGCCSTACSNKLSAPRQPATATSPLAAPDPATHHPGRRPDHADCPKPLHNQTPDDPGAQSPDNHRRHMERSFT
jgi:hypothetical protein